MCKAIASAEMVAVSGKRQPEKENPLQLFNAEVEGD